jgi:hypothetical protein
MNARRSLVLAPVLAGTAAVGFGVAKIATTPAAEASAARRYTLRVGDTMTVPAVGQRCAVYLEGGAPELFCARPRRSRHQVTIFADSILVWKRAIRTALRGQVSPSGQAGVTSDRKALGAAHDLRAAPPLRARRC